MNSEKGEIKKRGTITWDTMIPWIIAIGALVLAVIFFFLLKDKLIAMGDYIKNIFR